MCQIAGKESKNRLIRRIGLCIFPICFALFKLVHSLNASASETFNEMHSKHLLTKTHLQPFVKMPIASSADVGIARFRQLYTDL